MAKLNVAIADDNERILTLLDDILTAEEDINVVGTAKDGEETCRLIRDKEPDVVLLDLVMPRIDGLGVMDRIKHDRNVKKMPSFIIVSGITKEPVPEDAINMGASYYIMKPFDPELLLARISNILLNRRKLAECYASKFTSSDKPEQQDIKEGSVYSAIEERFMKKVMEIIHKNIENPTYSIDQFSEEIGMSRVQVYRKIKSVTGMSPSKLILDIRLKQAVDLLKHTDLTVTEISYRCGFNEISYFGKCFKTEYGMPPSEFIKKYRK